MPQLDVERFLEDLSGRYARAYAAMAFTYTASGIFFRSENADEAVAEALRCFLGAG